MQARHAQTQTDLTTCTASLQRANDDVTSLNTQLRQLRQQLADGGGGGRGGVCTLADALPEVRFAYHVARTSRGRCVIPASEPMQTLRTNCINGVNRDRYRPRQADAAPIGECTVLGAARLGVVQGFPADYPWPERRVRCKCRFCASSSVAAVSKQIGNAVPPRLAAWAISTATSCRRGGPQRRQWHGQSCVQCLTNNSGF